MQIVVCMHNEYALVTKQKMNHPNLIGRYCMTDLTKALRIQCSYFSENLVNGKREKRQQN